MWKEFQEEQFNRKTIESDKGFITYNIYDDNSAYIHVLYVKPQYRSSGEAANLENILIDKHKPSCLYCYVDLTSNNPEISLQAIIGVGYQIEKTTLDKIVLRKEIDYART